MDHLHGPLSGNVDTLKESGQFQGKWSVQMGACTPAPGGQDRIQSLRVPCLQAEQEDASTRAALFATQCRHHSVPPSAAWEACFVIHTRFFS